MKKIREKIIVTIVAITISNYVFPIVALADEFSNEDVNSEVISSYDLENENQTQNVVEVTENDLIINGEIYNEQDLKELLATAEEVVPNENDNQVSTYSFALGVGTYFIPGIGTVILTAAGSIILGGIVIKSGHWAFTTIKNWFNNPQNSASRAYDIPKALLDSKGNIRLGAFDQKVKGKNAWKDSKTGYTKEKDTAEHGGRKWKIKDKKGNRKVSTDANGKILSK